MLTSFCCHVRSESYANILPKCFSCLQCLAFTQNIGKNSFRFQLVTLSIYAKAEKPFRVLIAGCCQTLHSWDFTKVQHTLLWKLQSGQVRHFTCLGLLPHVWIGNLEVNRVLTAHTEWLLGVRPRHFNTTCAVHIEDCEGWWLSGYHSSVAEYWLYKLGVLGLIASGCRQFHFSLFHI